MRLLREWLRQSRWHWAAAVLLGASIAAYLLVRYVTHPSNIDLLVYRIEGASIRAGADPYGLLPTPGGLRATYPPFAALLFVPLTIVGATTLWVTGLVANLGLLVGVAWLSCRLAGIPARRQTATALVLAAVALWAEPVFTTLRYGQVNLLLLLLVLWDFAGPLPARYRGVLLGVATAIKVTPALFIGYLLLTGRRREAGRAIASFAATLVASALLVPGPTWRYWTGLLFDTSRVGRIENEANQSLAGVAARVTHLAHPPGISAIAVVTAVVGLWCAARAHATLGDAWGVSACAVTGLLSAPIAWTHHWVWCVPIAVLLWHQARPAVPVVVVFWSYAVWALPHTGVSELHFTRWQVGLSSWYVLAGTVFLAITALLTRRGVTDWLGPRPPAGGIDAAASSDSATGATAP